MTQTGQSKPPVLAIIGNGIAGISAARVARKLLPDLEIHIISSETRYFYSRTALMYIYMGHMRAEDTEPYERDFYEKNRLNLIFDTVNSIDASAGNLALKSGRNLKYDFLLLALGSKSNKFGWPGQDLKRVLGLYNMRDLEMLQDCTREKPRRVVVVGGGLIGIEFAEMMHSRHIPVTFLVREEAYMSHIFPAEESALINEEILEHGIDLRLKTNLKQINDDGRGGAAAVETEFGDLIACDVVGLTAGVSPNLDVLAGNDQIDTARGVLVDRHLRTNVPNVFAAGDCAQFRKADGSPGGLEQLWYTGRLQGHVVGQVIALEARKLLPAGRQPLNENKPVEPYDRGIWFNSAKFFNMEYQTYGFVPNNPDPETTFWWRHKKLRKGVRLVWEKHGADTRITGFNTMGIRYRDEVCRRWIAEERPIEYVVQHLPEANFDPEFFTKHEKEIQKAFKRRS